MAVGVTSIGSNSIGSVSSFLEILPVGIAPAVVFGLPKLSLGIEVIGIGSGLIFGAHVVTTPDPPIKPVGIASTVVFGTAIFVTPGLPIILLNEGIASTTGIGVPRIFDLPFYVDIDPAISSIYRDIPI